MIIYIIRHAWAGHADASLWPDDSARPLTRDGRKRFRRVVELVASRGFNPQLVITSPLVRCRQTANLVAEGVARRPEVVEREELLPGSDLDLLLAWTEREASQHNQVAWVGHSPDVGRIAGELISNHHPHIHFAKGSIAAVRFEVLPEPGHGELRWLVTADLLGA